MTELIPLVDQVNWWRGLSRKTKFHAFKVGAMWAICGYHVAPHSDDYEAEGITIESEDECEKCLKILRRAK